MFLQLFNTRLYILITSGCWALPLINDSVPALKLCQDNIFTKYIAGIYIQSRTSYPYFSILYHDNIYV